MNQSFEFYDARARESAAQADTATLENVRERALRSEKTWRGLADQALRIKEERAKADTERAERRLQEQAEAQDHARQREAAAAGSRDNRQD